MSAWLAHLVYLILDKILLIPLVKYFKEMASRAADEKKSQEVKDATDKAQTEEERIAAARANARLP